MGRTRRIARLFGCAQHRGQSIYWMGIKGQQPKPIRKATNATGTDTGYGGGVEGRLGYLVTDKWLVYSGLGFYKFDAGAEYVTVGIGTEYALTDNLSMDVEYKYWDALNNNYAGPSLGTSLLWHF